MGLEAHSELSSNYRKHTAANPLQRALIDRFHGKIVAEVLALSPHTFLDAGCGEGFVARKLIDAAPGISLTGCDVSQAALGIAAAANPEATFVAGSVVDLPFPDRSFDVVGCFEVLEHLPGDLPQKALSELGRVARQAAVSACRTSRFSASPTPRAEKSRCATQGQRSRPQAVLVSCGFRRRGWRAVHRAKTHRILSMDDMCCHGARWIGGPLRFDHRR